MNFQKVLLPILGVVIVAVAWRGYGWPGVALVAGGIVMWMLLHFTRMMRVLQRASQRPIGYCDSAVMLNAKLRPGVNLLHVMAMTRSLGEQLSPKDQQPEVYRWTDGMPKVCVGSFSFFIWVMNLLAFTENMKPSGVVVLQFSKVSAEGR
jgi:hypothetical protein